MNEEDVCIAANHFVPEENVASHCLLKNYDVYYQIALFDPLYKTGRIRFISQRKTTIVGLICPCVFP